MTRPEYVCAKRGCGQALSLHFGDIKPYHAFKIDKKYEDFWKNKKGGLVPLEGTPK